MAPASRYPGPDESPGFLLWRVANEWQRRQRLALEPVGLTHVQFVLLAGVGWLGRDGRLVTQAGLARHAHTDEMMTSQVVRALERRGLLTRIPHPDDQRAKCLALSPSGVKLLSQAMPLVEATDWAYFDCASGVLPELLSGFRALLLPPPELGKGPILP